MYTVFKNIIELRSVEHDIFVKDIVYILIKYYVKDITVDLSNPAHVGIGTIIRIIGGQIMQDLLHLVRISRWRILILGRPEVHYLAESI